MSEEIKQKKYQFETKIKLPNMQEILDAASDFTEPSAKKLQVEKSSDETTTKTKTKKDIMELAHKVALTPEQAELQKLGDAVADEAVRQAKEKELKRAEELRRLRRERDELAQKRAEEEQKIADEEKRKAMQAAREKAQARNLMTLQFRLLFLNFLRFGTRLLLSQRPRLLPKLRRRCLRYLMKTPWSISPRSP